MLSPAFHSMPLLVVFLITVFGWMTFEGVLWFRDFRNHKPADRNEWTGLLPLLVGFFLSYFLAKNGVARLPHATLLCVVGLTVMWLGVGLRAWAVLTLGSLFTLNVDVQPGQKIIESGPYRLLRHPAYLGSLIIVIGYGIAIDSWAAMILCTVLPLIGTLYRIKVEEREMRQVLGDHYAGYAARTARIIPAVW